MLADEFDDVLARAREGDEAAFAALFRDLQPALLRFLRVSAPTCYEDVAAETWSEIAAAIRRFRGDERGFRAWAFTIARHRAIDAARSRAVRREDPSEWAIDSANGVAPDPADLIAEAEGTSAAIRLIQTLPPDQAEALMLRVLGGLTNAQVAEVTGRSNGAVRVLVHRGLRRLAAAIKTGAAMAL